MGEVVVKHERTLWQQIWRAKLIYLLLSPFYILFTVFGIYPIGFALVLSFFDWRGLGTWKWAGISNYHWVVTDWVFRKALWNSLFFLFTLGPILVVFSLITAVILNIANLRLRGVYRTIYFLPYVTSTIIVAIVFTSLLDDTFGWVNAVLKMMGLHAIPWLRSAKYAKWSINILMIWKSTGYYTVIMLAGLQTINLEVYEAAAIDGASPFQMFYRITIPLLRPIIMFVVIIVSMGVMSFFEQPFAMTQGGPEWSSTTLTYHLYQTAFTYGRYGDASAMAFVISFIIGAIAFTQLKLLRLEEG